MRLTRDMKEKMQRAVQRGVRFLDKKHPDWFSRIDLRTLNIRSAQYCVLGQCFGDFWSALLEKIDVDSPPTIRDDNWAIHYGFNAPGSNTNKGVPHGAYEFLGLTWASYIAKRQVTAAWR